MNIFTRPTRMPVPEDNDRDKKNEETQAVVNDFLSEMRQTLRELQETSQQTRKDFPLASALRRSTK